MSLGRAASTTPRHAGGGVQWTWNTPWRRSPQQLTGSQPCRPAWEATGGCISRRLCGALG